MEEGHKADDVIDLDENQPPVPIAPPTKTEKELHYDWLRHFANVQLRVLYVLIGFVGLVVLIDLIYEFLMLRYLMSFDKSDSRLPNISEFIKSSLNANDLITLVLPIFAFLVGMGSSGSSK